jgi:O-antigen/teichoic acid export membrane protein
VAVVLTALVFTAKDSLLPGHPELTAVVPAIVLSYAGFVLVRGVLAARDRYKAYGGVTALESLVRLCAAVIVAALVAAAATTPGTVLLAWTLPLGALVAAAWGLTSRLSEPEQPSPEKLPAPTAPEIRPDAPGRFLAIATTANAAAQILLAASPLVVGPLGASAKEISVLFITVTAARVPLVILQGGLLSRLLPTFTRLAEAGDLHSLRTVGSRLAVATGMTAIAVGGAALLAGPPVIGLLFGRGFTPEPFVAAAATTGVVLATGSILLNQVLVASRRELMMLPPWLLGLVVAASLVYLTGDGDPVTQVLLGTVAGATTALVGLFLAIRLSLVTPRTQAAPAESLHADRK